MICILHCYEDRQFAYALKNTLDLFDQDCCELVSLSGPFDLPRENIENDVILIVWSNNCRFTQLRDLLVEFAIDKKFKLERNNLFFINHGRDESSFINYLRDGGAREIATNSFICDFFQNRLTKTSFKPNDISKNEDLYKEVTGTSNHPTDIDRYKQNLFRIMSGLSHEPGYRDDSVRTIRPVVQHKDILGELATVIDDEDIYQKLSAIVIDDEQMYQKLACNVLKEVGFERTQATSSIDQVKNIKNVGRSRGVALIVVDNRHDNQQSYWQELIVPLRQNHPDATILLVSCLKDEQLAYEMRTVEEKARSDHSMSRLKTLLAADPHIHFLPKGEGIAYGSHTNHLNNFAKQLVNKIHNRRELQSLLLHCALDAANQIWKKKLSELIGPVLNKEKNGITYYLDVIAEECISNTFLPEMHYKKIVICTEEKGLHNKFYNRVHNPDFFIFSDPFDGSTRFKEFTTGLLESDPDLGQMTMSNLIETIEEGWECGEVALNSPMVSVVLAERHRVVGAVLVNLFTGDVYLSIEQGNYQTKVDLSGTSMAISASVDKRIKNGMCIDGCDGWEKMNFRTWEDVCSSEQSSLMLCSLPEDKTHKRQQHVNDHVLPVLGRESIKQSQQYRNQQKNFTPGPGRILFLMETLQLREYEQESLGKNCYHYIVSAGEPLTEWMGWFAFLRHADHVSAFCLRERENNLEKGSNHKIERAVAQKYKNNDPSSMLPAELESIFRDGFIDIGVLHTTYHNEMRKYKDTLVICFNNDPKFKELSENYVKIPLFQMKTNDLPNT